MTFQTRPVAPQLSASGALFTGAALVGVGATLKVTKQVVSFLANSGSEALGPYLAGALTARVIDQYASEKIGYNTKLAIANAAIFATGCTFSVPMLSTVAASMVFSAQSYVGAADFTLSEQIQGLKNVYRQFFG